MIKSYKSFINERIGVPNIDHIVETIYDIIIEGLEYNDYNVGLYDFTDELKKRTSDPSFIILSNIKKFEIDYRGDDEDDDTIQGYVTTNDIYLDISEYNLSHDLKPSISHEITHIYEEFYTKKRSKENRLNVLPKINVSDDSSDWDDFIHLVYLHLTYEINARVTQLYYEIRNENIRTKEDFIGAVKSSPSWEVVHQLKDFNALEFYENFDDEEIKELISKWNDSIDQANTLEELEGIDELKKVPKRALDEPMNFLKYFERQFHERWNKFERKVMKLSYHFNI